MPPPSPSDRAVAVSRVSGAELNGDWVGGARGGLDLVVCLGLFPTSSLDSDRVSVTFDELSPAALILSVNTLRLRVVQYYREQKRRWLAP